VYGLGGLSEELPNIGNRTDIGPPLKIISASDVSLGQIASDIAFAPPHTSFEFTIFPTQ